MCQAVLTDSGDDARMERIQDFLEPRWQAVRPALPLRAHRYLDWAQSLAAHAALSGPGKSLRQMERRVKRWAGLPMRSLLGMGRAERVFFNGMAEAAERGAPNWAELADASGYADQSHLCRDVRRVTGFSPEELYRRIQQDEGFWSYRLWA
jgi:AraC-like DNA-binding protein